jgi:7,8-dihydroneopterin aldolase/epimerase/oxygenase
MADKIFIKGLTLEAIIGIYSYERLVKQPLQLDLELFLDITSSAHSGMITDTIDYDLVVARVSQLVEESHFDLIESLIQSITATLLDEFNVEKVRCTLYKPQAITKAQTVGITITRKKRKVT